MEKIKQRIEVILLGAQCANGHEWGIILPNYYFNLSDAVCPECKCPAEALKFAGTVPFKEAVRKIRPEKTDYPPQIAKGT